MSYASNSHAVRPSAIQTLSAMLGNMKHKFVQRRSYRQTVNALSHLSDHELTDLGLSRGSIHADAWHAVYGTRHQG
ncbi:DUF1127 domain-containing protein [Roseovarius sp. Pro17]|uniref:DUF1127 domain-containing protein n=1 Tax=Roseovarius sp. Pro17 TaxID=3108175 RepID=UPI002D79919F|nr:DUF1127 domain-containing protein [Roseovarius sp. Pro17]